MRIPIILICMFPIGVVAQPDPPTLSFTLAENGPSVEPLMRTVTVVQRYRERIPYEGYTGSYLGAEQELVLQGGQLFRDSTERWVLYAPLEAMAESYVLVFDRNDTMRIDLPEDPQSLIRRAWHRSSRETPEVIRIRKGCTSMEELIAEPWAKKAAAGLAKKLIAADDAAYEQQLADLADYYRNQPPPSPPSTPYIPVPPMTEEQVEAFWMEQPPLITALIERVSADTVWVKFNGRVMLNGGCGSGMPLFGVEMLTEIGWVERIPFDHSQMDCGLPWADWEEHVVMMPPLRWWVGVHQPEGKKQMDQGMYRLVLMGGNRKQQRTSEFMIGL